MLIHVKRTRAALPSMGRMKILHLLMAVAAAFALPVSAQERAPSRGELLYNNHCIACHSTQMHWRTLRLARDWDTLRAQVVRWKVNTGLPWSDAEVDDVTRHLNDTIYQYPQPEKVGRR